MKNYFGEPFLINEDVYHYVFEVHEIYRYKNQQTDFKWWHPNPVSDEYVNKLIKEDIEMLEKQYANI